MKINELRALIQEAIAEETSNKFSIKDKLNNMLFGKDENGVDGYLSQEWRLKRDITPKERSLRIALIIDQLKNYIKSLEEVANDEETFVQATTNEGRISNFLFGSDATDEELEAWLMKNKQIQTALNKMDPNKAKLWKEYVKSNKADKIKNSEAIMNVFWDGEKWGGSKPTSGNWTESKN
jgi:hypothetical protein